MSLRVAAGSVATRPLARQARLLPRGLGGSAPLCPRGVPGLASGRRSVRGQRVRGLRVAPAVLPGEWLPKAAAGRRPGPCRPHRGPGPLRRSEGTAAHLRTFPLAEMEVKLVDNLLSEFRVCDPRLTPALVAAGSPLGGHSPPPPARCAPTPAPRGCGGSVSLSCVRACRGPACFLLLWLRAHTSRAIRGVTDSGISFWFLAE